MGRGLWGQRWEGGAWGQRLALGLGMGGRGDSEGKGGAWGRRLALGLGMGA